MMELINNKKTKLPKITVIGVGGAGGNAVNSMINAGISGVDFVVANTDAKDLNKSLANIKLQLGANLTSGLGAGGKPEIGQEAAEESKAQIAEVLKDTDMLIISAGMGGGTGTGAAPIIASIANKAEILTLAIVSLPYDFEGKQRKESAKKGIDELAKVVDSLIVFPNNRISKIFKVPLYEAFKKTDEVIANSTKAIVEIVNGVGHIVLDFADIEAVLTKSGYALIGTGEAEGENRAVRAAELALTNPLLADMELSGCNALIVNAIIGNDLMPEEFDQIMNVIIHATGTNGSIKPGITFDSNMDGKAKVTVIATGLSPSDAIKSLENEIETSKPTIEPEKNKPTIPPFILQPPPPNDRDEREFSEIIERINNHASENLSTPDKNTTEISDQIPSQLFGRTEPPIFLKKLYS
jgi:cell division protein FtsZ